MTGMFESRQPPIRITVMTRSLTAQELRTGNLRALLLTVAVSLVLAACGSLPTQPTQMPTQPETAPVTPPTAVPPQDEATTTKSRIPVIARKFLGVPYIYGGATPTGFDCSGLVQYTFRQLGIEVPRTTLEQFSIAWPTDLAQLQPGDLLFFRLNSKDVSHVAIYFGDQQFIHAPATGRAVSISSLNNPFWRDRLAGAGRFF